MTLKSGRLRTRAGSATWQHLPLLELPGRTPPGLFVASFAQARSDLPCQTETVLASGPSHRTGKGEDA